MQSSNDHSLFYVWTLFSFSRSDRLELTTFEFDKKLLEEYKGTLRLNEVAVDDLTVENLKNR